MNISRNIGKYSYHIQKAVKSIKLPNVKKAIISTKEQLVAGYTEELVKDKEPKQLTFPFIGDKKNEATS